VDANLCRVILNDECMGGQTCLRMTAFSTATDNHVLVSHLDFDWSSLPIILESGLMHNPR
jgi:hypothetical protein